MELAEDDGHGLEIAPFRCDATEKKGKFLSANVATLFERILQNWPKNSAQVLLCQTIRSRVDRIMHYRFNVASTVANASSLPSVLSDMIADFILIAPTSAPSFW